MSTRATHVPVSTYSPDGDRIRIEYGVITDESGFWPCIWLNGRRAACATRRMDRDEALVAAWRDACDEAARYVGDWDLTVTMLD